eukprot:9416740-Pyramimonas_sp.AAC.1
MPSLLTALIFVVRSGADDAGEFETIVSDELPVESAKDVVSRTFVTQALHALHLCHVRISLRLHLCHVRIPLRLHLCHVRIPLRLQLCRVRIPLRLRYVTCGSLCGYTYVMRGSFSGYAYVTPALQVEADRSAHAAMEAGYCTLVTKLYPHGASAKVPTYRLASLGLCAQDIVLVVKSVSVQRRRCAAHALAGLSSRVHQRLPTRHC